MAEMPDNIDVFALNLGDRLINRPTDLPHASIYQDIVIDDQENPITAKDVISEVSKQMKDVQDADCVVHSKEQSIKSMTMNKYKKSAFVSVNMLSRHEEIHEKPQADTDTQLALDTQLFNVIRDAEALGTAGLTQEFQSTFSRNVDGGSTSHQNPEFPILDISLKEPDPNKIHKKTEFEHKYEQNECYDENEESVTENIIFVDKNDISIEYGTVKDNHDSKHNVILIRQNSSPKYLVSEDDNLTQFLNENIETEDINEKQIILEVSKDEDLEVEGPSSQVLSVKESKMSRKRHTSSPLVIDLETFEKFEELASPLLINTVDDETAKRLISSQIIEQHLSFKVSPKINEKIHANDVLNYQRSIVTEPLSADCKTEDLVQDNDFKEDIVLASSKLNNYDSNITTLRQSKVIKTNIENSIQETIDKQKSVETSESQGAQNYLDDSKTRTLQEVQKSFSKESLNSDILKDEILFSSDEEEEFTHNKHQDLPMTCVLETSFYDEQSNVLDKTMYVGFQTASNKSIKVLTDSFCRAKSFLSEENDATVTELVNICSEKERGDVSNTNKTLTVANVKELIKSDSSFETKLEEIKEKITNTITLNMLDSGQDLEMSSASESLEIVIPDKLKNIQDNRLVDSDLLSEDKFNDEILAFAEITGGPKIMFDPSINKTPSIQTTESLNDNDFELSSQIISYAKPEGTINSSNLEQDNPSEVAPDNALKSEAKPDGSDDLETLLTSQVLSTSKDKGKDTKTNKNKKRHRKLTSPSSQISNKTKHHDIPRSPTECDIKTEDPSEEQVKVVCTEPIIEADNFPSSQIISLKPTRCQKRKKDLLQTDTKRHKLCEIKAEVKPKDEFEDMDFDTCDFKEILIQENLRKNIGNDQVDSKFNSKNPVLVEDALDFEFDIKEMLLQENLNKLISSEIGFKGGDVNQSTLEFNAVQGTIIDSNNYKTKDIKCENKNKDVQYFHESNTSNGEVIKKVKDVSTSKETFLSKDSSKPSSKREENSDNIKTTNDEISYNGRGDKIIKICETNKVLTDEKTSSQLSRNIETNSENSEELPFFGFSNLEDKIRAVEEIAKCKKLFEEFDFDQSILGFEPETNTNSKNDVKLVKSVITKNSNTESKSNVKNEIRIKKGGTKNIGKSCSGSSDMFNTCEASRNVRINVEIESNSSLVDMSKPNQSSLQGSKTAYCGEVTMSEEALTKLEYYFKDLDKIKNETKSIRGDQIPVFHGFKTASRKPIQISTTALERTKKIFQNIDKDFTESQELKSIQPVTKTPMKKTYRGTHKIGKYSITKKDMDENSKDSCSEKSMLLGFQTVNNKPLRILTKSSRTKKILENIDESDEDQPNVSDNNLVNVFEGFKTASNKQLKISDTALSKGKKLFQDIESKILAMTDKNMNDDKNLVMAKTNQIGFQTASNKHIQISDNAKAKGRNLFQDIQANIMSPPVEFVAKNNQTTKHYTPAAFQGIQIANNEEVETSEKALAVSRRLFPNRDSTFSETPIDSHDKSDQVIQKGSAKFQGFHTASNKQIKVSDKALIKARQLFQDIDNKSSKPDNKKETLPKTTLFQGFQTASYKPIEISEKSIARGKKLFQDIDSKLSEKTVCVEKLDKEIDKVMPKTNQTMFKGFQTASNKQVYVSENALAKGRQLFQDIDSEDSKVSTRILKGEKDIISESAVTTFIGFQTASNKQINISEKALEKVKTLFQDIDSELLEIPVGSDDKSDQVYERPKPAVFQGFQTASNKSVNISEEALAKSKQMMQCLEETAKTEKLDSVPSFQGFKTGSNKHIKVSKEALAKSRKIFENIDKNTEKDTLVSENNSFKFQGFQTGSNKKVEISEDALAKSKKIFQSIDYDPDLKSTQINISQGFMTANKKNVTVSKEALEKSKNLLQGTYYEREYCNNDCETNDIITPNINIDNIINTQVIHNFEETLHTEDFFKEYPKTELNIDATPKTTKRPSSPILSCPKSKKKKRFEIPYSQKIVETVEKFVKKEESIPKTAENHTNIVKFIETYKQNKAYTLKDVYKLEKENTSTETKDSYILNFDFENLFKFEFFDERNDLDQTTLTIRDLIKKFEVSVNEKLIPTGWIENHVKLILWKLISYEIKFPKTMKNTCTARNLLEQLKYRYGKELFNTERPVLRKILEKDDLPGKTMILCVVAFFVDGVQTTTSVNSSKTPELLLTDGWYTIRCTIDKMLTSLVHQGRIVVGTKIATCGAEMIGDEQGVSPWEDTSAIRLKIHGNSTRLARWDARLGCHGNAAILSKMTSVKPDGGKVCKLRCTVTRVYPALYVDKFASGNTVTRSERLEHLHQMKYETERQVLIEKLYEDVEKEFALQESQDSPEEQSSRNPLDSGSQIARQMKMSRDPQEFRATLTSTQLDLLTDYETRQREKYINDVQTRIKEKIDQGGLNVTRNVVPLVKVRVVGIEEKNGEVEVAKAMLSIWKPNDAIREILTEGATIEMMNVVPTALRYSELQISAGRQSVFNQSKHTEPESYKTHLTPFKRTCYPIKDLYKNPNITTEYNEIDTVGYIFEIDPENKNFNHETHQFQNVYLADAEKNILCINFWGGIAKFGYESILDTGQVVSCTNLQKRAGNTRKFVPQYRATEFTCFTKTPKSDVARKMIEDLITNMAGIDKIKFCEACKSLRSNVSSYRMQNTENVTPYRFTNIDINTTKTKAFIDTPLGQRNAKTDENLNLTGLDFESTFQQPDTQEFSPNTLLRKRQVKEKIDKLKKYGEPPPLSPITILNKSKNAGSAFKSPLISKSDSPICVSSDKKIVSNQDNCDTGVPTSPIVALNRTYIKRNVNPVKLNFSTNIVSEDTIDHFAEDFDGSPPLSLE